MNRQDAAARLEALLARVVARKDAPRTAVAPSSPGAVAPPKSPRLPLDAKIDEADVSVHTPLAGDPGVGPEIDLIERTMDLDIPSIEAAVAASPALAGSREEPLVEPSPELTFDREEAAPSVTVSEPEESSSVDLAGFAEPEPEPAPVARVSEPDAFVPATPVAHMVEPAVEPPAIPTPELLAPTPDLLREELPELETHVFVATQVAVVKVEAPKVEAPKVEAPKVEAPKVEHFEPAALPVSAAVVQVVAADAPAPRTLRELLARSLALRVRPTSAG
jgi:hypothetical protein